VTDIRSAEFRRVLAVTLYSALGATLFASLTFPLVMLAIGRPLLDAEAQPASLGLSILQTVLLLPFGVLVGATLAIPTALIMGVVMTWLTNKNRNYDRLLYWIVAGALAALPSTLIVGNVYDLYPDRALISLWLVVTGMVGAALFWRRRARIKAID
jgi:hypothetical protein